MKTNKGFSLTVIILFIVGVLAVGGVVYYIGKNSNPTLQNTGESNNYPPANQNGENNLPTTQRLSDENKNLLEGGAKNYLEVAKKAAIKWQPDAKPVHLSMFEREDICDPSKEETYGEFVVKFYSVSASNYVRVEVCKGVAKLEFYDYPLYLKPPFEISGDFIDESKIFTIARGVAKEWNLRDIVNFHAELSVVDSTFRNFSESVGGKQVWTVGYYAYNDNGQEVSGAVIIDAHSGEILKKITPDLTKSND